MDDEMKAIWRHLDGRTNDLPAEWVWRVVTITDATPALLTYWLKNEWLLRRNATKSFGDSSISLAQRTQDKHHCHLEIHEDAGDVKGHIILLQFRDSVTEIHWRSYPACDASLKNWLESRYDAVPQ